MSVELPESKRPLKAEHVIALVVASVFLLAVGISQLLPQKVEEPEPQATQADSYATGHSVTFEGAKLSIKKVARVTENAGEHGDYLLITFWLDNTNGDQEILLDVDDYTTVQLAVPNQDYLIRDQNVMLGMSKYPGATESFKIGEQGPFDEVYDLNPGSIKENPNVKPADIALVQMNREARMIAPKDPRYKATVFTESLARFWNGPFEVE